MKPVRGWAQGEFGPHWTCIAPANVVLVKTRSMALIPWDKALGLRPYRSQILLQSRRLQPPHLIVEATSNNEQQAEEVQVVREPLQNGPVGPAESEPRRQVDGGDHRLQPSNRTVVADHCVRRPWCSSSKMAHFSRWVGGWLLTSFRAKTAAPPWPGPARRAPGVGTASTIADRQPSLSRAFTSWTRRGPFEVGLHKQMTRAAPMA